MRYQERPGDIVGGWGRGPLWDTIEGWGHYGALKALQQVGVYCGKWGALWRLRAFRRNEAHGLLWDYGLLWDFGGAFWKLRGTVGGQV